MAGKHAIYRCDYSGCSFETESSSVMKAHKVLHIGRRGGQ